MQSRVGAPGIVRLRLSRWFGDNEPERPGVAVYFAEVPVFGVPRTGLQCDSESVDDAVLLARLEHRPH